MRKQTLLKQARSKFLNQVDSALDNYHNKTIGKGLLREVIEQSTKEYYLNRHRINSVKKAESNILKQLQKTRGWYAEK